jgi:hypothetical protein
VSAAPTNNNTRARPQLSGASESFAVPPRRPVGLIAVVLVVDLGLAAAGAVLLAKGLSKSDAKSDKSGDKTEKKTELETPPPPGTPASGTTASGTPASGTPASGTPASGTTASGTTASGTTASSTTASGTTASGTIGSGAAARDTRTPQREDKSGKKAGGGTSAASGTTATSGSGPVTSPSGAQPVGSAKPVGSVPTHVVPPAPTPAPAPAPTPAPAAAPSPSDEIDAKIAKAKSVFAHCGEQFPGKGIVQIAMQVRADGKVINVAAVENSTGNPQLAQCIGVEIASWTVSPHSGDPVNLFRPFTYP